VIVRVKYCGGCNSSYDRPAFVERVREAFPSARFTFSDAAGEPDFGEPDIVLAVCGCPAACAARGDIRGSRGQYTVTSQNDFASACDEIRRAESLI
jgi:hypothetical protein